MLQKMSKITIVFPCATKCLVPSKDFFVRQKQSIIDKNDLTMFEMTRGCNKCEYMGGLRHQKSSKMIFKRSLILWKVLG